MALNLGHQRAEMPLEKLMVPVVLVQQFVGGSFAEMRVEVEDEKTVEEHKMVVLHSVKESQSLKPVAYRSLMGLMVDWELHVEVPVDEQMMAQHVEVPVGEQMMVQQPQEMMMGLWLQDMLVAEQTWEQHE